jgi:uncharacterized protein YceH (UPF0502 family)
VRLSFEQGRVIGSLIEKQLTTPQQCPLTLNSLVLACNQTSNRDPVVSYEEGSVQRALASLKEAGVVRFVYPSSGRSATRYRHVIDEALSLGESSVALLAVLLLRGPQTVGELRARTERMTTFDDLGAVGAELEHLAGRVEPLVVELSRRPGQKEERWAQLLTPDATPSDLSGTGDGDGDGLDQSVGPVSSVSLGGARSAQEQTDGDFEALSGEIASLRGEVAELRAIVERLQTRLDPEGDVS